MNRLTRRGNVGGLARAEQRFQARAREVSSLARTPPYPPGVRDLEVAPPWRAQERALETPSQRGDHGALGTPGRSRSGEARGNSTRWGLTFFRLSGPVGRLRHCATRVARVALLVGVGPPVGIFAPWPHGPTRYAVGATNEPHQHTKPGPRSASIHTPNARRLTP